MQRILFALVALISLIGMNIRPAQGQQANDRAVEPTAAPVTINERSSDHGSAPTLTHPATSNSDAVVLSEGQSVANLSVHDKPLVLEGHVEHDVMAINSAVTIKSGATVGGHVVVIGGSVENQAGSSVRVVEQNPGVLDGINGMSGLVAVHANGPRSRPGPPHKDDFVGGQFALLVLGLIGGLVALLVAPRASQQVASKVTLEPARSLVVGGLCALALLVVQIVSSGIMQSPIRYVWAPMHFVLVLASLLLLFFGWLCGMRFAGELLARRMGQAPNSGGLFARIALGLVAFFLLNSFLSLISMHLAAASLMIEAGIALMGLGAVVVTGGGSDPNWLTTRLHGEARWFRR